MNLRYTIRRIPLPEYPHVYELRPVLQQECRDAVTGWIVWRDVPVEGEGEGGPDEEEHPGPGDSYVGERIASKVSWPGGLCIADITALDRLISAVVAGDEAAVNDECRSINRESGGGWPAHHAITAYRGSLDAALALHEALLPGWTWVAGGDALGAFAYVAETPEAEYQMDIGDEVRSENPARAWLLATLKAYRGGYAVG